MTRRDALSHPLLALVLTAFMAGGQPVIASEADDPAASVAEILRSATQGPELDQAALSEGLRELGADAAPGVFAVLLAGGVTDERGQVEPLSRSESLFLRYSLRGLPVEEVTGFLAGLADNGRPVEERVLALSLLGETGSGADLGLALRLAPEQRKALVVEPEAVGALEQAITRLVRRDPGGVARLPELLPSCHPALAYPLVRSVARSAADGRLVALCRSLGRVKFVDPVLLLEIERVARAAPSKPDALVRGLARPYLKHRNTGVQILAAQAATALDDRDAVGELIDLLDCGDADVEEAAHRALVELTGLTWDVEVELWATWHEQEVRWWSDEASRCRDEIAGGSGAAAAILEVSRHRLYPDRAAAALLPALKSRRTDVAILACKALAGQPSDVALPALVDCLASEDLALRGEAYQTLRTLTGLKLPLDVAAWRGQLEIGE